MKKTGFIIWNGKISEANVLWQRTDCDWVLVDIPDGRGGTDCIKTTKEAVYPDRETPEKILAERRVTE